MQLYLIFFLEGNYFLDILYNEVQLIKEYLFEAGTIRIQALFIKLTHMIDCRQNKKIIQIVLPQNYILGE